MDGGAILYDGPLKTIRNRFATHRSIICETLPMTGQLTLPDGAELLTWQEHRATVRFDKERLSASQAVSAIMAQVEVRDFTLSEPDLESVIKQIYGGALGQEVAK